MVRTLGVLTLVASGFSGGCQDSVFSPRVHAVGFTSRTCELEVDRGSLTGETRSWVSLDALLSRCDGLNCAPPPNSSLESNAWDLRMQPYLGTESLKR